MIVILWSKGEAAGCKDILPSYWFREEGQRRDLEHHSVCPGRVLYLARCSLVVAGRSATLGYGGQHAEINREHDISVGDMRIMFADDQRHEVVAVEWRSEEGAEFVEAPVQITSEDDDDDTMRESIEGHLQWGEHFRRYRDRGIVWAKKQDAIARGDKIACEACKFDFAAAYGKLGVGVCEVHHRHSMSEGGTRTTSLDDLAILCANCHRVLHRAAKLQGRMLSVDEFSLKYVRKRWMG